MPQSDRHIDEKDRCSTCKGLGWTVWTADTDPPEPPKWVVCRACIGTGRSDQKGRKRVKPEDAPSA